MLRKQKNRCHGSNFIGEYEATLREKGTDTTVIVDISLGYNRIEFTIDPINDNGNPSNSDSGDEAMQGNFSIDRISEYFWDIQSDGTKSLKKQAAFQKIRDKYYGFEEDIDDDIWAYQFKFNDNNELTSCRIQKYNNKKQLRCITITDIKKSHKKPAKLTDWNF